MPKNFLGKGKIADEDYAIKVIGESFESPHVAIRQYIDNGIGSIEKKISGCKDTSNIKKIIIIDADKKRKSIRITDFGVSITPIDPIWENPKSCKIDIDEKGRKVPYVNSFENMRVNIGNSVRRFMKERGLHGTGMLSFVKLHCKKVDFICKIGNKVYTYTITRDNEFYIDEGGDKKYDDDGVEVLLDDIDQRIMNNWFNEKYFENFLSQTYHTDLINGKIKINLILKDGPFISIKPMEIIGHPFHIDKIKTKKGNLIILNLKIRDTPEENSFVKIDCRGSGGCNADKVLDNPIWKDEHLWGYVTADFLNFEGNDKTNFQEDDELNEFREAVEQIENILYEEIRKIKSLRASNILSQIIENVQFALSKTLKELDIDITGTKGRKKICPKCKKILPWNQATCPDCGFIFPKHIRKCPYCKKEIPHNVKKCPYCNKDLIDYFSCPNCGEEIPKLSFKCPNCGFELRKRKEPEGKQYPPIYLHPLGVNGPRCHLVVEEEKGVKAVKGIQINHDHKDYNNATERNYTHVYFAILISKEIAKYQYGEEKKDYSDEIIDIKLSLLNKLIDIDAINIKDKIKGK